MRFDFIVLGGTGQQGRICARDLLEEGYSVLLCGRDSSSIKDLLKHKKSRFARLDLQDYKELVELIKKSGASVVINCAELNYNVDIMRACLAAKKSCTDLGGLHDITKQQFKLEGDFKKQKIICITGCGSTPGITNVMAAHAAHIYDSVDTIELGFAWDSNLKIFVVPYSIKSIFDEFTQDPVLFHNGKFLTSNQMTCQGTFTFREIGRQTCYCIVHSEVYTFAKYFTSNGLKHVHYYAGFPEHSLSKIKTLIELGFNSREPINVKGVFVRPRDVTTSILKRIVPPKGYQEKENLWVRVSGKLGGKETKMEMNCIVKTLKGWESAGSNVNTGRTISIISQMVKEGVIEQFGVYAPEAVVPHGAFFRELGKRKMYVYQDGKRIN